MRSSVVICLWVIVAFQVQARALAISNDYLTIKKETSASWKEIETGRLGTEDLVPRPRQWVRPADKKVVFKLRKKINARKKDLLRKIEIYERKGKKKLTTKNVKKAKAYFAKVKEAKLGYMEMQQAEIELVQLENSSQKFTFSFNEENISYTYMDLKGVIIIEFNSYVNAIHELSHAFQHLTGEIEYLEGTGGAIYIDILDELRAYRRQYFFAPYSFNKLRSDSNIKINKSENIKFFWVAYIYFMKKGGKYYPYKDLKIVPLNKPKE